MHKNPITGEVSFDEAELAELKANSEDESQINLDYEPGGVRNDDPDTSHEAAYSVNSATTQGYILDLLRTHPDGLTAHEMSELLRMALNTVSPCTAPLLRKEFIVDSGERRPGPSGRRCIVWKLKGAEND